MRFEKRFLFMTAIFLSLAACSKTSSGGKVGAPRGRDQGEDEPHQKDKTSDKGGSPEAPALSLSVVAPGEVPLVNSVGPSEIEVVASCAPSAARLRLGEDVEGAIPCGEGIVVKVNASMIPEGDAGVTLTASLGDQSKSVNYPVSKHTALPKLELMVPVAMSDVARRSIEPSGACEAPVSLSVLVDGDSLDFRDIACADGAWVAGPIDLSSYGDGPVEFKARSIDRYGNTSTADKGSAIDTVPPVGRIETAPGSWVNAKTISSFPLAVGCDEASEIVVTASGVEVGRGSCLGAEVRDVPVDLSPYASDTEIALDVVLTDLAGNASATVTASLNIKTELPSLSLVVPGSANGAEQGAVELDVTCSETGREITYVVGSVEGSFSCSSPSFNQTVDLTALADGEYAFTFRHEDVAGNEAEYSAPFVKKATPPLVAILKPEEGEKVGGAVAGALKVEGSCSEDGRPVAVRAGARSSSPTCLSGRFEAEFDISGEADGPVAVAASMSDSYGNDSLESLVSIDLRQALPSVSVTSTKIVQADFSSYILAGGCSESGQFVEISGDVTAKVLCVGSVWAVSGLDLGHLPEGLVSISATHTDKYGNNVVEAASLLKDTVAPSISIVSPAPGFKINAATAPTFAITMACDDPTATLQYSVEGAAEQAVSCGDDDVAFSPDLAGLSDETTISFAIYAVDPQGNKSDTKTLSLYKDVLPPVFDGLTLDPRAEDDYVTAADFSANFDLATAVAVTGQAAVRYALVPFASDCSTGTYGASSPKSGDVVGADGTAYKVCVELTDAADNGPVYGESQKITKGPPPPPGAFSVTAPSGSATSQPPTISWQTSSGATSYDLLVASDSACASVVQSYAGITATSKTLDTDLPAGIYYVCVTSKNKYDLTTESSPAWSFRVGVYALSFGSPAIDASCKVSMTATVQKFPTVTAVSNGAPVLQDGGAGVAAFSSGTSTGETWALSSQYSIGTIAAGTKAIDWSVKDDFGTTVSQSGTFEIKARGPTSFNIIQNAASQSAVTELNVTREGREVPIASGVSCSTCTGTTPASLSVGSRSACMVAKDGKAYCWGDNDLYQLGVGNNTSYSSVTDIPAVGLTGVVRQVAVTHQGVACALMESGYTGSPVKCWGDPQGASGPAPSCTGAACGTPRDMTFFNGKTIIQLAAGASHICALEKTSGNVHCWGDNSSFQIGALTRSYDWSSSGVKTPITGAWSVAVGPDSTCAIVGTNRNVKCLGSFNSNYDSTTPLTVKNAVGTVLDNVVQVAMIGYSDSIVVLDSSGTLYGSTNALPFKTNGAYDDRVAQLCSETSTSNSCDGGYFPSVVTSVVGAKSGFGACFTTKTGEIYCIRPTSAGGAVKKITGFDDRAIGLSIAYYYAGVGNEGVNICALTSFGSVKCMSSNTKIDTQLTPTPFSLNKAFTTIPERGGGIRGFACSEYTVQ